MKSFEVVSNKGLDISLLDVTIPHPHPHVETREVRLMVFATS
jgi:hypothetical protein